MRSEPELPDEIPCFAAETAIECALPATWRIETLAGTLHACDRHQRLVEVKCDREGLAPRVVPGWCRPVLDWRADAPARARS